MSKELEALERIDNTLCLNNNKGKLEFGIDTEEHTDCDGVIGMTEDLETIKSALTEYTAIKNAKPSEALKELNIIRHLEIGFDKNGNAVTVGDCNGIEVIKQALIKAEKEHNSVNLLMQELDCKDFADLRKYARCGYQIFRNAKGSHYCGIIIDEAQEPKKYLKWEDLEFNRKEAEYMKVSLNGTKYCLVLTWGFCEPKLVKVKPINLYEGKETDGQTIFLLDGNYINDVQFFNDLRLERVEE